MIPVSAALAAAIDAPVRQVHVRLRVDWDRDGYGPTGSIDDLSRQVGTVTIDRSLAGAWPAGLELAEGSAAAALDAELTTGNPDDPRQHAAWWFSRANPATPLAGKEHLARPCTLDVGFTTQAGAVEWVRRFTGTTRMISTSSRQRTARLQALDSRDLLRKNVTLPGIRPDLVGLNATWLISYILHQTGIAPSPPARTDAPIRLWLPMHAGCAPFLSGDSGLVRVSAGVYLGEGPEAWRNRPGPFVPTPDLWNAAELRYDSLVGSADLHAVRNPDDSLVNINPVAVEAWWLGVRPRTWPDWLPGIKFFDSGPDGTRPLRVIHCDVDNNGVMHVAFRDGIQGPAIYDLAGPQIPNDGLWHFVGWRINVATRTVTFKLDHLPERVLTFGTATGLSGLHLSEADVQADSPIAELQVTGPNLSGLWLNQVPFTPAATIDLSTLELDAVTESQARQAWSLLGEIAAAEQATVGFDEAGRFGYRTRDRLRNPNPPVKTLTAQQSILDLDGSDAIDQVGNDIAVNHTPTTIHEPFNGNNIWIWRTSDPYRIAGGGTLDLFVSPTQPAAHLDTRGWVYDSNPDDQMPITYVTVARNPDGTGRLRDNIAVSVPEWTPGTFVYRVVNSNPFAVYLVNEWDVPAAGVAGRTVRIDRPVAVRVRDAASVATYGEQPYDAPTNQWVQRRGVATILAQGLLADLARADMAITGLEIIGDPRLQLGDKVRVVDRDGLALDGHFLITGINETITAQGKYTMRITARRAP